MKILGLLLLFLHIQTVFAHPPGLSSADLSVGADGLNAKITFATQDIEAFVPMDSDQDAEVTPAERDAAKSRIATLVAEELVLQFNGNRVQIISPGTVNFDDKNNATVELHYPGKPTTQFSFDSKFLSKLPPGHKQYVTVTGFGNLELGKKMLTQQQPILEISLKSNGENGNDDTHSSSTFTDFLKLGIEHILTGYDHLLFLFSLLIITREFWPALKIITFFTLAHSITLALAGMNILDAPSNIVEPLIAASIVYVGLENIIRKDKVTTRQRCFLTFFFGLVHGFGFAGVLREMDISSIETGIVVPLFSFNLGVELGQIAVASVALPLIWWLHKKAAVEKYLVLAGSILTSLAGGYWLLERTVLG